jgi:hypothetical protein
LTGETALGYYVSMQESTLSRAAAELGRRGGLVGGQSKSPAKQAAASENGKLGGRPRQFRKCSRYQRKDAKGKLVPGSHRFDPKTGRCPCGYHRETAQLKV